MKEECKIDIGNIKEKIKDNEKSNYRYYKVVVGIGIFFLLSIFSMLIFHLTGIKL
jgi:hypothetical protein